MWKVNWPNFLLRPGLWGPAAGGGGLDQAAQVAPAASNRSTHHWPPNINPLSCPPTPIPSKNHPQLQNFFPKEDNVTYLVRWESRQQSFCVPETAAPLRWLRWVLLLWPSGAGGVARPRRDSRGQARAVGHQGLGGRSAGMPLRDPPAPSSYPSSPSYYSISSHSAP